MTEREKAADYRRTTTILMGAFGSEAVAEALGIQPQTFKQTRLVTGAGRRTPPENWENKLAPLVSRLEGELASASL